MTKRTLKLYFLCIEYLLFNRDEIFHFRGKAMIGTGMKFENARGEHRGENPELSKMFGPGKEVTIPCVLLPLNCELKREVRGAQHKKSYVFPDPSPSSFSCLL